jgi:hypothetical protein
MAGKLVTHETGEERCSSGAAGEDIESSLRAFVRGP